MTTHDFGSYVEARWERLVRAARLLGCGPEEAEDLVQNTLVRCHVHWRRIAAAHDIDAYVHRMLINQFKKSRRRAWHAEVPSAPEELPEVGQAPDALDLSATVATALARLPLEQRAVVILRLYMDLSERSTSEALDVPIGTVKSRLSRALAALADDQTIKSLVRGQ